MNSGKVFFSQKYTFFLHSFLFSVFYKNSHNLLKLFVDDPTKNPSLNHVQNQAIVFYDSSLRLFLRGYIIGRDPDSRPSIGNRMSMENVLEAIPPTSTLKVEPEVTRRKTASLKRPRGPSFIVQEIDIDSVETPVDSSETKKQDKTSETGNGNSKWIVYGIDTGQYYIIKSSHLYKLVEQFAHAKPFAVVCKISHPQMKAGNHNNDELKDKFKKLVEHRFHCLQYHDVDFTTERNLVTLFLFEPKAHSLENVLDFIYNNN